MLYKLSILCIKFNKLNMRNFQKIFFRKSNNSVKSKRNEIHNFRYFHVKSSYLINCKKDYKMVLKYMMIIAASDDLGYLFFFPLLYMQEKEDYNLIKLNDPSRNRRY